MLDDYMMDFLKDGVCMLGVVGLFFVLVPPFRRFVIRGYCGLLKTEGHMESLMGLSGGLFMLLLINRPIFSALRGFLTGFFTGLFLK